MRPQFKFKLKPAEPVSRFINPDRNIISYSKKEKYFLEVKNFILRNKLVFLGVMLALFMLFRYLYYLTNTYKSEVTFSFSGYEIPEFSANGNAGIPGFASMNEGMSRIYNMVYSKEMYDHLINKFDLYAHFGLDPAKPSHYSLLRTILKQNITLFQGATKALAIQVTDRISGVMSANIANEIVRKSNEMNRRYITEKIENRIKIYTKLHDEIKAQTEIDIQSINPSINRLNEALGKFNENSLEMQKTLFSLNEITKKIEGDVGQLLQISKVNSWTLNAMQDDVISNVLILQDALPGEVEENFPKWLLAVMAFLASFFITLLLFNLFYSYRHYLDLLRT